MKKITNFLLCITMIISVLSLFGCDVKPTTKNSDDSETETKKPKTTVTEEETGEPDLHDGIFYTIEDFATFAKTGSRNPEDYSKDNPPFAIPYRQFKKESFLNLNELFKGENNFLSDLKEITVNPYGDGRYEFNFKSGIIISISYNEKFYSSKNPLDNKTKYTNPNKIKNISLSEAEKGILKNDEYIAHKIDDYTVVYNLYYHNDKLYEYSFITHIDGFQINISVFPNGLPYEGTRYDDYKKLLADPLNAPISVFFTEGEERTEAFQKLVNAIENREVISDK